MLNKSIWIARLLARRGALSKRDILDAWRDEDDRGLPMAQSTFYDNLHYLEQRYGLRVVQQGGRYGLCGLEGEEGDALRRLLGAAEGEELTATDAPTAAWLPLLADAVASRHCLRMDYRPPGKAPYATCLRPYALAPIRGLHYVVGQSERHGAVRTFAVDRIEGLVLLPQRFRRPADFSLSAWFAHSFGAYGGPDVEPRRVVLEARSERTAAYLRSRPLHPTQTELPAAAAAAAASAATTAAPAAAAPVAAAAARFQLDVALTRDFVGCVLSFGSELCVVEPSELRAQLAQVGHAFAHLYADEPV